MLGITLLDRKRNTWIRQETGVSDIVKAIRMAKHGWAGHIARLSDNRRTIRGAEWSPRDCTRKEGSPKTRWRDDLTRQLGPAWSRLAKNRYLWDQSSLCLTQCHTPHLLRKNTGYAPDGDTWEEIVSLKRVVKFD